jgi:hypothetical protein
MGFLDWLGGGKSSGKSTKIEPDSVWLHGAARLEGLCAKAERVASEGRLLVLAHFPAMLDAVEAKLRGRLSCERADSDGDVASWLSSPDAGLVGLAIVEQLPSPPLELVGRSDGHVSFLVVERHPLRDRDERVERVATELPYSTTVQFLLSLDDPLLERFVDDRVTELLTRLGMSDDDELAHPAISGAVESAQTMIARESGEEVAAESSEGWLDAIGAIEPR